MSLTKMQKVSLVLAYIPVISTIVAAIKIHYYNKSRKEHEQKAREALDVNATTIHDIAQATFKQRTYTAAANIENVAVADAAYEVMPGINILAALHDTHTHYHLSKIQDDLQLLEDLDSFLLRHYNAPDNLDGEQREILLEAFKHLYVRIDVSYKTDFNGNLDNFLLRREYAQQLAQGFIDEVMGGIKKSGAQMYQDKTRELYDETHTQFKNLLALHDARKEMGVGGISKDTETWNSLNVRVNILGAGLNPAKELKKTELPIDGISNKIQNLYDSGAISKALVERYGLRMHHYYLDRTRIAQLSTCIELISELIDNEDLIIQGGRQPNTLSYRDYSYENDQRAQVVLKMVSECRNKIDSHNKDSGKKIFRDALEAVINKRLIDPQKLDKAEKAVEGLARRAAKDQANKLAIYKNITGELQEVLDQFPENN